MKSGLLLGFLMMCCAVGFAQVGGPGNEVSDKLYYGLGGSFSGGTSSGGYRYIGYSLFPIIGYRITDEFSAGTGITYQHYSYPDVGVTYNQYGVTPFMRYNFGQLFFQSEYDIISSPSFDNTARRTYNRFLFGLGFTQPFREGGRGAINAMAMYDVLYRQPSVFNSPIVFRVFVTF